VAAKTILESDCPPLLGPGARLFDKTLQLHLKLEQALAMPLDALGGSARFLKVAMAFMAAEQRVALQTRRLQEHCAQALRRSEWARRRLELSQQRLERQTAERARRRKQPSRHGIDAERAAFRRQQQRARKQAAQQRAAASPLAQLRWRSVTAVEAMEPAA
jgi:hypothetical protein